MIKNFLTKTKTRKMLALALLASTLGVPPAPAQARPDTLYQVSTLQALALGLFDGPTTLGSLLEHGDFGLGTLNALDGEMVILDGQAWQARFDGKVLPVPPSAQLPFAVVTHFRAERRANVTSALEYSALHRRLDESAPTPNTTLAVRIRGRFSRLKVRSVPRQQRPYPPLVKATETQAVWEWENVSGTLVGFRFPSFLSGVNLADYHFHFLSDDKTRGGHVLDVVVEKGTIELDSLRAFEMVLPPGAEFDHADLKRDQSADLEKAEKG